MKYKTIGLSYVVLSAIFIVSINPKLRENVNGKLDEYIVRQKMKHKNNANPQKFVMKDKYLDVVNEFNAISNPTQEMCEFAIKQNIKLKDIKNQTDFICKIFIKHDVSELQGVKNQTDEICKFAIQKSIKAFKFINCDISCLKEQNYDGMMLFINNIYKLFEYAIMNQDEIVLYYVYDLFDKIKCMIKALEQKLNNNKSCDNYLQLYDQLRVIIDDHIYELCILSVKKNGNALRYVKNQTDKIRQIAITQNASAIEYVDKQTDELCNLAVSIDGYALKYIKKQTEKMCRIAVMQNGEAIQYVNTQQINYEQFDELCNLAVSRNGIALKYIKNSTKQMKETAIKQNCYAILYIENPTDEMRELVKKQLNNKMNENTNNFQNCLLCSYQTYFMKYFNNK